MAQSTTSLPSIDYQRLVEAARAGERARVAALLAAGVPADPPDEPSDAGESALHAAAGEGQLSTMRLLLRRGADPVRRDRMGATPVHLAAIAGRTRCVAALLDHGVSRDLPDIAGRTPLQEAVQGGHLDTARFLVARGADVNIRDHQRRSALSKVFDKLRDRPVASAMESLLLQAGAERVLDGKALCLHPLMDAIARRDLAAAERHARADPASVHIDHFRLGTPLDVAARLGAVPELEWLLAAGETPATTAEKCRALECAAEHGHADAARVLLRADCGDLDARGATALALAARHGGSLETVELLLEAGADPRAIAGDELTARDAAGSVAVRERLRRAMLATNPRPRYRRLDNAAALAKAIVSEGVDSPRLPSGGVYPLHCAAQAGSVEVIELLLQGGAELLDYEAHSGWRDDAVTPLASWHTPTPPPHAPRQRPGRRRAPDLRDFVDGLGGGMVDIDWRNTDEADVLAWFAAESSSENAHYPDALTPLHMAAAFDMPDVVTALIEMGAHLERRTHMGETPLVFGARRAGRETVWRLLQAGADMRGSPRHLHPLHEACAAGNAPAAGALIDAGADVNARVEVSARERWGTPCDDWRA